MDALDGVTLGPALTPGAASSREISPRARSQRAICSLAAAARCSSRRWSNSATRARMASWFRGSRTQPE